MTYLGKQIKKLGFGLMRLPQQAGRIDIEETKRTNFFPGKKDKKRRIDSVKMSFFRLKPPGGKTAWRKSALRNSPRRRG